MEEKVLACIEAVTGKKDVGPEHYLVDDLALDSFSFIRLVVDLENTLDVRFDDADLDLSEFQQVRDLTNYICKSSV